MTQLQTLTAAAALLVAVPAACQSAAREIGPGSAEIRAEQVRERADTLDLLVPQGGGAQAAGMVVLQTTLGEAQGVLVRVERITDGDGNLMALDSFTVDRATLAPLTVLARGGTGMRKLRWEAGRVRGHDADGGTIDVAADEPAFYSNSVDMVLAALPLAEGYEAAIRFSGGDEQNGSSPVRVTGQEDVTTGDGGRCRAWRVEVGGSGHAGTYWIGAGDRALVRFDGGSGGVRILRRNGCGAAPPGNRATR